MTDTFLFTPVLRGHYVIDRSDLFLYYVWSMKFGLQRAHRNGKKYKDFVSWLKGTETSTSFIPDLSLGSFLGSLLVSYFQSMAEVLTSITRSHGSVRVL